MKTQLIGQDYRGLNNTNLQETIKRLKKGKVYRDLSTICIVPTRGMISAKVVSSWEMLMKPMNQKFIKIFAQGYEVGQAYNESIAGILAHPILSKWKYILTLEDDNMPPPDGLLKLYENMDKFDVIGGLYFTKGEGGQPMIYGDPLDKKFSFRPQVPRVDMLQPANGLGMGFNLFKMNMFKDKKLEKPWFKTEQEITPGKGARSYTQDLYFYEKAGKLGYNFACDTRVKVGHYDSLTDTIW